MTLGFIIGVISFMSGSLPRFISKWNGLVLAQFTGCAIVDVLNTTALCYYLWRIRSNLHTYVLHLTLEIELLILTSLVIDVGPTSW